MLTLALRVLVLTKTGSFHFYLVGHDGGRVDALHRCRIEALVRTNGQITLRLRPRTLMDSFEPRRVLQIVIETAIFKLLNAGLHLVHRLKVDQGVVVLLGEGVVLELGVLVVW